MESTLDRPSEPPMPPPVAVEDVFFAQDERRMMEAYSVWWTLYTRGDLAHNAAAQRALTKARLAYQKGLNALDQNIKRAALTKQR